jgi:hypothetical protein
MSMKSADEPGLDHGDYIEFVMLDGTKRVPCRVSQEAIDDIEGGKPPSHERMERFNRHPNRGHRPGRATKPANPCLS